MRYFIKFVNIILIVFITFFKAHAAKLPEGAFIINEKQEKVLLESFEGNVVLLHFWATWCQSCMVEMPEINRFQKEYAKEPIKVIALSQDYKGIDVVKKYIKDYNLSYIDAYLDQKNKIFRDLLVPSLPHTILIDKKGNILESYKGSMNWNDMDFRKAIELEAKK